jgi:alpha-mannosidase
LKAATQRRRQVEPAFENYPESKTDSAAAMLRDHWRNVVFHQFHDTLGGTCLPSAYRHVQNELGAAEEWGNALLNDVLRIRMRQLPDDEHQRIMLYNASDVPYDGWMEVEPWMGLRGWHDEFGVFDEQNQAVPFQKILNESLTGGNRLAVRVKVAPGQIMALHIDDKKEEEAFEEPAFTGDAHCMGNQLGAAVALYPPEMMVGSWSFALPDVLLYPDNSDTWSHGIDRYPDKDETLPTWGVPQVLNDGKHVREIAQRGRIGNSDLLRRFRIYSDTGAVELLLRVDWQEHNKVLKLVMPVEAGGDRRTDGIPGAHIDRAQDGAERPVRDWTMVPLDAEEKLAIVSPDVFALDGTKDRLRLTLLRSPQMAHHDPYPGGRLDGRYSDRGEHDFHFWFMAGADVTPEKLDQLATMMQRPLITADYTRGMKPFM